LGRPRHALENKNITRNKWRIAIINKNEIKNNSRASSNWIDSGNCNHATSSHPLKSK
jgi:hypothetical protein